MYEEHDIDVDTGYSRDEVCDLPWPRFPQLRAYLRRSGKTDASRTQLRNRLIDRFGSILAATGAGDMYTESHGYPLAALLERDVVYELQGLKTEHQDFLIEFLLTWVFRYRQARQERDTGLQHAIGPGTQSHRSKHGGGHDGRCRVRSGRVQARPAGETECEGGVRDRETRVAVTAPPLLA